MKLLFRIIIGLFRNRMRIEKVGDITVFIIARNSRIDMEILNRNCARFQIPAFYIQTDYIEGIKIIKI